MPNCLNRVNRTSEKIHTYTLQTCPAGLETITRLTGGENRKGRLGASASGMREAEGVCVCVVVSMVVKLSG